ncbi:MAG: hypothetical protein R2874_13585 [Desulfobacterales bacterium]
MTDAKPKIPQAPRQKEIRTGSPGLKPGSDAKLKRIFAEIGVPDKQLFIPDPFQLDALKAFKKGDCR